MLGLCLKIVLIAGLTLATVSEIPGVQRNDPRNIVYPKRAREGMFPWTVALYHNGEFQCTGSIISPTAILTAAHCVNQRGRQIPTVSFFAMVGSINRRQGRRINFRRITSHPKYNAITNANDIAVMQTTNPMIYGRRIQPICLPGRNTDGLVNRKVFIMGWGSIIPGYPNNAVYPFLLQYDEQIIVSTAHCAREFRTFSPQTNICTGRIRRNSSGACYGDSGGPLVYYGINRPIEVGIVSFGSGGNGCGDPESHDVFTKVASYIRFIRYAATGRICIL